MNYEHSSVLDECQHQIPYRYWLCLMRPEESMQFYINLSDWNLLTFRSRRLVAFVRINQTRVDRLSG